MEPFIKKSNLAHRLFNQDAFVFYPWIFINNPNDKKLLAHELVHVMQVQRDGWLHFYLKYLYYHAKYGYKNNPYEIEARDKTDEYMKKIKQDEYKELGI